jgi:hypothetical protein
MLRRLVEGAKRVAEVATLEPNPLRFATQQLLRRTHPGDRLPFLWRMRFGALPRANYAFCMQRGAALAAALGIQRISVIEFGVAGGNGLLNMEAHAQALEKHYSVRFDVYGFDMGRGLPRSTDPRDLPYRWREGLFAMDRVALEQRLSRAQLILGDVQQTIQTFVAQHAPAPLGAIAFDLDYYSSTRDALRIFDIAPEYRLPRVCCYIDDLTDTISEIGVLKAISEYNLEHPAKPLDQLRGNLPGFRAQPSWRDYIYELHDLTHPLYSRCTRGDTGMLPLAKHQRPQ